MGERNRGIVYLVGAGPGDPKLITVKGLEVLRRADVVVYDHLVSERLLESCRPRAQLVYAGKEKGRHTKSQEEVNRLLVRFARTGKIVVRLKGGDPLLFGRGGEEALALAHARVPYEIVPGVTSAIAVPAYAGIPVTHRQLSSSVTVVTGHEDPSKPDRTIRWDKLATATDTLVCLMGVSTLPATVEQLIRYGRAKTTPCAVIEWGTFPRQRTVVGTLGTIVGRCEHARVKPPAIVVVGEVVGLRRWLNWFETKPLFGVRILVTRPAGKSEMMADHLEALGACVLQLPAIELAPIKLNGVFRNTLDRIETFDWVFFTSPEGIGWFSRLLIPRHQDVRILRDLHIGAIGPKTAASIRELGIHVDFVPRTFSQEGILAGLKRRRRVGGKRALILSAEESRDVLEKGLRGLGMSVERIPIYRTLMPKGLTDALAGMMTDPPDLVTVTSSSCVEHLARALEQLGMAPRFRQLRFASIGPVTSATIRKLSGRVAIEAAGSTTEGLVDAIVQHAVKRRGRRAAVPTRSTSKAPSA